MGITQREVAKWLKDVDVGAVNRRLTGKRTFLREELDILDWVLGENGALLEKAGYIPDDTYPPKSRYLDEEWLRRRLDEKEVVLHFAPLDIAEGCVKGLLGYLASVQEDRSVRRYKTWLELDNLDLMINRFGIDAYFLLKAKELETVVQKVDDNELTYYYESSMTDFCGGARDDEQALLYERRALKLVDSLERPIVACLETEISIVNLLALTDPSNSEAEQRLETVKSALYVPSYDIEKWPKFDETNYLESLQAEFNLRLYQGGHTSGAGDVITIILGKFLHSPYKEQNATSLLCAAEFYATDGQQNLMEDYLKQSQELIDGDEMHWYDGEVERIRELFNGQE
jgi:hypothetical protein